MIYYKIDILKELKNKNLTTYTLKKDNILSGSLMNKIKNNNTDISLKKLDDICRLLGMQPGDIIGYKPDTPPITCDGSHDAAGSPEEADTPPIYTIYFLRGITNHRIAIKRPNLRRIAFLYLSNIKSLLQ